MSVKTRSHLYDKCACGARKRKLSQSCQSCVNHSQRGSTGQEGIYKDDSVWTISRRESIITFARGDELRSVHCIGQGKDAQIRDGERQLKGGGWIVQCRSTPQSILTDLRRQSA